MDDIKLAGKKQNINPTLKILMKGVDVGEPTSFLDHVYLGCTQRECQISKNIVDNYRNMFESRISAGAKEKLPVSGKSDANIFHGLMTWKVMQISAWKDSANWQTKQLNNYTEVATPCIDDHQFEEEEMGSVGELSTVCSQIVLKCQNLARIGGPDFLWSVNKLARAEHQSSQQSSICLGGTRFGNSVVTILPM